MFALFNINILLVLSQFAAYIYISVAKLALGLAVSYKPVAELIA